MLILLMLFCNLLCTNQSTKIMKVFQVALLCLAAMFFSCQKEEKVSSLPPNLCADVNCPEFQHCVEGDCVCIEEGYTGENCDEQITPDRIQLLEVRLKHFPALKPIGVPWDAISPEGTADVYFKLSRNGISEFVSAVDYDQHYDELTSWDVRPNLIKLDDVFSSRVISLYDRDLLNSSDDTIAFTEFKLYSEDNGFPPVLYIDDGELSFELELDYSFQN